jgi:hypothetical protein
VGALPPPAPSRSRRVFPTEEFPNLADPPRMPRFMRAQESKVVQGHLAEPGMGKEHSAESQVVTGHS